MNGLRDHHATPFVPADIARPIEAVRRAWDPAMARQIGAHVTLVYPQEEPDPAELIRRTRSAGEGLGPARFRLGGRACFGHPEDGVYLRVEDVDGIFRELRDRILRPPFRALDFPPHITLIHPRTSSRGREYWETERFDASGETFTLDTVSVTAFDGDVWTTIDTIHLHRP